MLFLIATVGLTACSPKAPLIHSVKSFVTTGYSQSEAVKASHFKVIDDFASRDFKNRIGGVWSKRTSDGIFADLRYTEDEAVAHSGFAIEGEYRFDSAGQAVFATSLNDLDISRGEYVTLWLSVSAHNVPVGVKLKITDGSGKSRTNDISEKISFSTKAWQEIILPVDEWRGLDFNRLSGFELILEGRKGAEGILQIDQIAFFGPEDVFIESLKDNLIGFASEVEVDRKKILNLSNPSLAKRIAEDTWKYFDNAIDRKNHLPLDHIKLSWRKEIGDYTSPTNIGLYWISALAAYELGIITKEDAASRIERSFKTVERLQKWKGFLYNYYNTTNLQVTNKFVSSVDNAWLAAGLYMLRAYFPGDSLGRNAEKMLGKMDFYEFFDAGEGKFNLGYDDQKKKFTTSHYGLLVTEARIISVLAIMKGNVEPDQWFRMHRTLPASWKWQTQAPEGRYEEHLGIRVFEGYYRYGDRKIVPSWGGSLFEFLMPSLLLKEHEWAPEGLGKNNRIAAEIHRDYAWTEKKYPVWGISPCMIDRGPRSAYLELGIKGIAAKGYKDEGVVTPHASILALHILPEDVFRNLRKLIELYPIYGEYGLYDSVQVQDGTVTKQYLALDQGMILISLANYLKKGIIREKFHSLPEIGKIEPLYKEERFFAGNTVKGEQ